MKDILSVVEDLRRPKLLLRAARHGADEYRREQHLRRHLGGHPGGNLRGNSGEQLTGGQTLPITGAALIQLVEIERELNDRRHADDAGYSVVRHVDVMIAMIGEARLLRAARSS